MSLLQIKKLNAPLDLRRESLNTTGTQANTASGNATYTPTDEGVFTCYFNRNVIATDFPQPTTPGGTPGFDITVSVYDECYYFIYSATLNATQANIRNNDHICFKLTMSDDDFQRLGGCNVYVHVVIETTNDHVQFRREFSENYHETIKHIHIYDKKKVNMVYWSTKQQFSAAGESESIRKTIALNEDAFIHIRTFGLWGKDVIISIYERSFGNTALAHIVAPMGQNRKVVVVSMKYLLACYCNKANKTYSENEAIDLKFYIKTDRMVEQIETPPLASPPALPGSGSNPPENDQVQVNPFRIESEDLHLESAMDDQTLHAAGNGTVFLQVNKGEAAIAEPDRYRDFLLGYMCHIEGIGKLAKKANNTKDTDPEVTVYPLHTYEIMLKDLVECGLVTLEEAIYLTTVGHDMQTLDTRERLQTNFNKTNASLDASGKLLMDVFLDTTYQLNGANHTYANSKAIRKLLAQIQHKEEVFASKTTDNNALHYICRDAWQSDSGRASTRYDKYQECPFGEFFLNYVNATYELFAARSYTGSDIQLYDDQDNVRPGSPNQNNKRDGIAFHKGRSFASTGCLTFNLLWDNTGAKSRNNYNPFNDTLYPTPHNNVKKLNFVCMDERHAISPATDRRYHDLINPSGVIQT